VTAFTLVAALAVALGAAAHPSPAAAASSIKVVIVVGPVGSSTASYISSAKRYATLARGYGAKVTEIYSPNATWTKVKAALQGANLLIYLGHGNGWPSPYGPFQKLTKDGLGLNRVAGAGNSNTKYWGEYYIDRDIQMAKNAIVILNRLCYASGNSEWGSANPTKSTAIKRVDNFGAGFPARRRQGGLRRGHRGRVEHDPPAVHERSHHGLHLHGSPGGERRSRLLLLVESDVRISGAHGSAQVGQVLAITHRGVAQGLNLEECCLSIDDHGGV